MPSHRQRYRCASRRADRPSGRRTGTARSRHGDPVGSPVRYASRAGDPTPRGRPAPARLHRGRAVARHARYASAGAAWGELPPGLPARLAGGRGDAVASPTLPLRIAPCRSLQRTARRHCSLASRRPRRVASSLRLARRQSDPSWQTRTGSLASRPRRRATRSLRLGRCGLGRASTRPPGTARWRGVAMPSHRRRCRCASRRADRSSGQRAGTARSRHGDPIGSPVRYASRAATSANRRTTLLRHRDDQSRSCGPTIPATSGRP